MLFSIPNERFAVIGRPAQLLGLRAIYPQTPEENNVYSLRIESFNKLGSTAGTLFLDCRIAELDSLEATHEHGRPAFAGRQSGIRCHLSLKRRGGPK